VVLSEQIVPGSFAFALDYLVDNELDLQAMDAKFKNDEVGASAYDPREPPGSGLAFCPSDATKSAGASVSTSPNQTGCICVAVCTEARSLLTFTLFMTNHPPFALSLSKGLDRGTRWLRQAQPERNFCRALCKSQE
ncbi:MAG: hypothetical protein ACKOF9_17640, partial [Burkholderiales bacterium]